MTEAVLDIKKWGNSLGMRLPSSIAKAAHLHLDQRVRLVVENDQILILPLENKIDSLKQRLDKFSYDRHGGEVMDKTERVGVESW